MSSREAQSRVNLQSFAGRGLLGSAIVCERFARAQSPRVKRGHFQCRLWCGFSSGWCSSRASCWGASRLPTGGGSVSVIAVPVPAAPPWCDLFLSEGRRAGLVEDGGRCRGGVDGPNGGIGNYQVWENNFQGRKLPSPGIISVLCARAASWASPNATMTCMQYMGPLRGTGRTRTQAW